MARILRYWPMAFLAALIAMLLVVVLASIKLMIALDEIGNGTSTSIATQYQQKEK